LEIRELQRSPDQFNVYLIGLRRFQNTSQDDKLSYFQIAGMHGLHGAKQGMTLTV
jgi:tyrosinase